MKAISVLQPWASLIACGAKQYETRSWFIKYRGLLALHAGKRFDELQKEFCNQEVFNSALFDGHWNKFHLPLGAIIAVVKVVDVLPAERIVQGLNSRERAFGNFGAGRYAWKLEVVKQLEKPIPMNGKQGLFDVADDLIMRFM